MGFHQSASGLKWAVVVGAVLMMAACAKSPAPQAVGVASPGSPQDFAENVGDRVFFDTDSSELSPQAQATLNKQARWLEQYPQYNPQIQGNADERGTREYNFALGARRAEAVKEYLIARGVAASRLRTISFGKERPVATCNNISCWSQNRRVVTALTPDQS